MSWMITGYWVMGSIAVDSAVRSADSQRRAAHTNADISRQKAKIAVDQATVNEDAQRRRAAIALGTQRAAAAQSGTGLDGTNADLFEQSSANAELDALNIRYQGKLGILSNNEQAGLDDMRADDASNAQYLNAASSALSGYGSYVKSQRGGGGSGGGLS